MYNNTHILFKTVQFQVKLGYLHGHSESLSCDHKILSFETDRHEKRVQTQIRLLL